MEIPGKKISAKFYLSISGHEPVREWLLQISVEDRKIIGKDIQQLELDLAVKCKQEVEHNGKTTNPYIGSLFDDFLDEQGIREECEHQAIKEILANQARQIMLDKHISKTAMDEQMKTSRRQLD